MIRTFKNIALAASTTPQPVFGTKTTAAIAPAALPGSTQNASVNTQVSIPVSDSSWFLPGDIVNVDVGASEEKTSVASVPDSTHIVVSGLTLVHASGIYVRLAIAASVVYIQPLDGNTGYIYIGNKYNMVYSTGVFCIKKLLETASGTQPNDLSLTIAGFPGPLSTAEFWFDGNHTGDVILPSIAVD